MSCFFFLEIRMILSNRTPKRTKKKSAINGWWISLFGNKNAKFPLEKWQILLFLFLFLWRNFVVISILIQLFNCFFFFVRFSLDYDMLYFISLFLFVALLVAILINYFKYNDKFFSFFFELFKWRQCTNYSYIEWYLSLKWLFFFFSFAQSLIFNRIEIIFWYTFDTF